MPHRSSDLFRLVYRSRSSLDGSAPRGEAMIEDIIATSQRRNAEAGITGALIHTQSLFVQALEGPALAVEAAFDRICCDLRHERIEVAEYGPVLERGFGSWSMRRLRPNEPAPEFGDGGEGLGEATAFAATTMKLMAVLLRATPTASGHAKAEGATLGTRA